jgi:hypothetical protein
MKTIKVRNYSEVPTDFTGIVKYTSGTKVWYRNGKQHRVDGPAIEDADGTKEWWLNGECHRVDGPAIEHYHGSKEWWLNGKLHRVDGPAVEDADGTKRWFLNGKQHRVDGPAYEDAYGSKYWWLNGKGVYALEPIGDYILIEEGLPSDVEWLGKWVTQRKVLTEKGIMHIPNLPGI